MTKEQIAAFIQTTLEREVREARLLNDCEHDHDFAAKVRLMVDDLTMLTDRFEKLVDAYYSEQPGLHSFTVYHEPADTDTPKQRLGTVKADTAAEAIQRAALVYEKPADDIVVTQVIEHAGELELPLPSNYQPAQGDTYILKLWVDQFEVRRYNGTEWVKIQHFFSSEQDVTLFILAGMQYLGSTRNHRHYYRPQPEEENKQS